MSIKKYFKCKSIDDMVDEAKKSHDLERSLGAFQLVMLGIGAIIGAGIFVFTGTAAGQHAGPAITVSFVLAGFACAIAAMCYAELASMIPVAGSSYTYAYATLGELPAWIMAGMIMLTYALGAAAVASGWSGYLQSFMADYGLYFPAIFSYHTGAEVVNKVTGESVTALIDLPALAIVILLASIVYRGADTSATFNAVVVTIKMIVIFGFIVLGASSVNPDNWVPFIPENTGVFGEFGYSGIITGAAIIFLSYTGFDAVATAAQETKNPKRDLPIGIIGSLFISISVYVLVALVLTGVVPYPQLNNAQPMAVAVDVMGMPWFSKVVKVGAIAGLTSVVLVLIFGIVRVLYAVTHDGLLPDHLAKTHKKYHTPHLITLIAAAAIGFLASVVPIDKLVKLANFGTLVTFSIVCFGTLILRYTRPKLKREFVCPFSPVLPVVGIVIFAGILYGLPNEIFFYASIWIAFLLLVYFAYGRNNSHLFFPHNKAKVLRHKVAHKKS
jgi:APA family basic amino acid/polyamine antiporter